MKNKKNKQKEDTLNKFNYRSATCWQMYELMYKTV